MAKKKKSQKKKFRQPNQMATTKPAKSIKSAKGVDTKTQKHDVATTSVVAESIKKPVKKSSTPDYSEFSYVAKETKHTLVIIGGIIVVYLVLWYLFTHTGIGPAIYRFIKL